jgi:TRAP-type transport system periplasmic protein
MTLARRSFLASAAASIAAPAVIRSAVADAPLVTFKLHHSLSSVSSAHNKFLVPWARTVEKASGGRIRIDIFPSMELGGQPAELFDQVRDGVVDIAYAAPHTTPGRFPKIELFELPFVPSRRALVSSKAIEDYAAANLGDEFRAVHPISFSCSDRAIIHAHRAIETVKDVKGLRLHVRTRWAGEAVTALGARAVAMPRGQLPLAITQRVIDGCLDPWDMAPALKLYDLLKTHTDFDQSSLCSTTFVLAMNNAAYHRLPPALKMFIDDNSGQVAADLAGAMWDLEAKAIADLVGQRGDSTITTLAPAAVAPWRRATEPVIAMWLREMKKHNLDGDKLLASARALLAKYANIAEPQQP